MDNMPEKKKEKKNVKLLTAMDAVENEMQQERVFRGILGALLFALIGGVLWVLLWTVGVIVFLAGIAVVALAANGYRFFGKKFTKRGMVISIIISVIVIVIAMMASLTVDVITDFRAAYEEGEIQNVPNVGQAFAIGMMSMITDKVIRNHYLFYLALALVVIGAGAFLYFKPIMQKIKEAKKYIAAKNAAEEETIVQTEDAIVQTEEDTIVQTEEDTIVQTEEEIITHTEEDSNEG